MNHRQISKLAMLQSVRDFLLKNPQITALIPGFANIFATLVSNILRLISLGEQQSENSRGVSGNKEKIHNTAATWGYDIAKKVEAFAKMTNNTKLATEMHFTESDLFRATDFMLRNRLMNIHAKASANLANLEAYDITESALTEFKEVIDIFVAAIPSTRTERMEKKAITDEIATLFKDTDAIVDKFDSLVEVVRLRYPTFYNNYFDNRRIVNTASGSLVLSAHITDAASGEGIKGAKATFVVQSASTKAAAAKPEKPIVKKTSDKGIFRLKKLPDGIYTVTIEKVGYKPTTVTVAIANGEMTILKVSLEANA